MKQLMISIKPEHLVNILNGKKTLELRSYLPKGFTGPVNIYCSKSKPYLYKYDVSGHYYTTDIRVNNESYILNGKVVARFWFDEYEKMYTDYSMWVIAPKRNEEILKMACLSWEDADKYSNHKLLYAWHIKQLEIFDEPKELGEFYKEEYAVMPNGIFPAYQPLTHAPQKYAYVWAKEE